MTDHFNCNRRRFLKAAGVSALAAEFGSFSIKARAAMSPAGVRLGFLTDTFLGVEDDPEKSARPFGGRLYGSAYALADDLMDQLANSPGLELVIHGGSLTRSGNDDEIQAALAWASRQNLTLRLCASGTDATPGFARTFEGHGFTEGRPYYSYDLQGFHFIHLATSGRGRASGELMDRKAQLAWLRDDLAGSGDLPVIAVVHSARTSGAPAGNGEPYDTLRSEPRVVVVLSGASLANSVSEPSAGGFLHVVTCSPVLYPCGARTLEIEVGAGKVSVESSFMQTRLLTEVEKSFYQALPRNLLANLGGRDARSFTASPGGGPAPVAHALDPNLVQLWSGSERVRLALLSDTHVCLDKFMSEKGDSDYKLIGHFPEAGSRAIFGDILDQASSGRHRVEFFDEVFAKNPGSESNYLEFPVDAMLICGDLSEHGRLEESKVVRDGLEALPERLRGRTFVTPGNHDMYVDFSPRGQASGKKLVADFYAGFGPRDGRTHYVVPLCEWASLVVTDTSIPSKTPLGMIQEEIDWLEDVLNQLRGQVVMVASHHPLYALSLVPPLMTAYLRGRSHFTPKHSAARMLLQDLFARHNNVKMVISGHYHGTVVDQFRKAAPPGSAPDDAFTTHLQVPCTIEYPNGYRLLEISRQGGRGTIEYLSAYTRKADLRQESREAPIFKILGTETRVPHNYQGTLERLREQDNVLGHAALLDPYDLVDLNVRGFKDGTARAGRGNTGRPNIAGRIEFTI